jgi:cytochrome b pre-mRNA-processing protein 3
MAASVWVKGDMAGTAVLKAPNGDARPAQRAGSDTMFGLFRNRSGPGRAQNLHETIMAGVRTPELYTTAGVPDTLEGRFEMVALHGTLLVRRLNEAGAAGRDVAQVLTDAVFENFEIALRETGVGDIVVPKRMKKLAQNYLGRFQSYRSALDEGDADRLAEALARNVFSEASAVAAPGAGLLVRYALDAGEKLAASSDADVLAAQIEWPAIPRD